eukprot:COSAG01_NODE_1256_length_11028_cov_10.728279_3_plen_116_part_00
MSPATTPILSPPACLQRHAAGLLLGLTVGRSPRQEDEARQRYRFAIERARDIRRPVMAHLTAADAATLIASPPPAAAAAAVGAATTGKMQSPTFFGTPPGAFVRACERASVRVSE